MKFESKHKNYCFKDLPIKVPSANYQPFLCLCDLNLYTVYIHPCVGIIYEMWVLSGESLVLHTSLETVWVLLFEWSYCVTYKKHTLLCGHISTWSTVHSTSRLIQTSHLCAYDILMFILVYKNSCIFIQSSKKIVTKVQLSLPHLVKIMAWCRTDN